MRGRHRLPNIARCVLAVGALAAAGCRAPSPGAEAASDSSFGPLSGLKAPASLNPMQWGADSDEPRRGAPDRIIATWINTVRHTPGEPAERGFGGRLYFYDRGPDPIAIDGRLVVYAFDESGRQPTDHKPTRRFVFPAEEFAKHLSKSEIGPSYSVWLPWGSVDGASTNISLIARFEPAGGGGLVVSDQATQRLPGRDIGGPPGQAPMIAATATPGVQQAAYEPQAPVSGAAPTPESAKRRLTTTTISLPR